MTDVDATVGAAAGFMVVVGLEEALDGLAAAEERRVLLFMPHCERVMYESVLRRFWGTRLEAVTVFGNCFSRFYGAGESRIDDWSYMDAAVADGVAVEIPCGDAKSSLYHNAFNDLAVTTFDVRMIKPLNSGNDVGTATAVKKYVRG